MGNIYYIISSKFERNIHFRELFRSAKRGELIAHIDKNWFPKEKPVGGDKVMYQHCLILRECGFNANLIKMGDYSGNFFGYDIEAQKFDAASMQFTSEDFVVIPEYMPYLAENFGKAKKILFVQNYPNLYNRLRWQDRRKSYHEIGFDHVIYCSEFLETYLYREHSDRTAFIPNFIDLKKFVLDESKRVSGRVLALPRKNPQDLSKIMSWFNNNDVDFQMADGLTESQLITEYQKADIFLATGYPEGFGLPPLEAMACGCAVVGFTGKGADSFMIDQETALVAPDGDTDAAAYKLSQLLNDLALKQRIRESGNTLALKYDRQKTVTALSNFYERLGTRAS